MKTTHRSAALAALFLALAPGVPAAVPNLLNYQGRVAVDGANYSGMGKFKFALVDGAGTTLWRNDGVVAPGEPVAVVSQTVAGGLYAILLGDTAIMAALTPSVFAGAASGDVRLRVWFSHDESGVFQQLAPDTRLAATPFALVAHLTETVDASVFTSGLNGSGVFGTSDATPLTLQVNGQPVARFGLADGTAHAFGHPANTISELAVGATIAGGGAAGFPNSVLGIYSTVSGGLANAANGSYATIGGGKFNSVNAGEGSVIAGGSSNSANGFSAAIGGGANNSAAWGAAIAGGSTNTADDHSSIGGGLGNTAVGLCSIVPGGSHNTAAGYYAFAAGRRAKANHEGSFVWADSTDADFASTGGNQFLIRAAGGVGINNDNPNGAALAVNGNVTVGGSISAASLNIAEIITQKIGTTSNQPLEWIVNNQRGFRLEYAQDALASTGVNVIGGWAQNAVAAGTIGATIGGGGGSTAFGVYSNRVEASFGTVSGGSQNTIQSDAMAATIGGGTSNTIQAGASVATIPGGLDNSATSFAFAAGRRAKANHQGSFVWADATDADFASTGDNQFSLRASGGMRIAANVTTESADAHQVVIGPQGNSNVALWLGYQSNNDFIPGGGVIQAMEGGPGLLRINPLGGDVSIGGTYLSGNGDLAVGRNLRVAGNPGSPSPAMPLQIGDASTPNSQGMMRFASRSGTGGATRSWDIGVPEGDENIGDEFYSFVIDDFNHGTEPEVVVRWDSGNVGIGTSTPVSKLQVNGTVTATAFNPPSDRNLKENFAPVNSQEMLEKVVALPLSRWNFIGDAATPHVGPMAQDFHAAFSLGTDERHIATVDADGVALAAIQGVNQKLEREVAALHAELTVLRHEVTARAELQAELTELRAAVRALAKPQAATP